MVQASYNIQILAESDLFCIVSVPVENPNFSKRVPFSCGGPCGSPGLERNFGHLEFLLLAQGPIHY